MGTKQNPGAYDCHAKAQPDEPMFTLLARDPLAPHLVDIWAAAMAHDWRTAIECLWRLIREAHKKPRGKPEKIAEAYRCAADMAAWRCSPPPSLLPWRPRPWRRRFHRTSQHPGPPQPPPRAECQRSPPRGDAV